MAEGLLRDMAFIENSKDGPTDVDRYYEEWSAREQAVVGYCSSCGVRYGEGHDPGCWWVRRDAYLEEVRDA